VYGQENPRSNENEKEKLPTYREFDVRWKMYDVRFTILRFMILYRGLYVSLQKRLYQKSTI